jgi:hypothetical protein
LLSLKPILAIFKTNTGTGISVNMKPNGFSLLIMELFMRLIDEKKLEVGNLATLSF